MTAALRIENPQLAQLLAERKINVNQMTADLLADFKEIRTDSKKECDEDMVRRANVLMRMFTVLTNFVARTPDLADGDEPPKIGRSTSVKANRMSAIGNYKLPPPPDALD